MNTRRIANERKLQKYNKVKQERQKDRHRDKTIQKWQTNEINTKTKKHIKNTNGKHT